jgi:hypothetical protein
MKPLTLARKVAVLLAFVASAPLASHGADADGRRFASNHQGVFGGQKLRYSAIVEERFITDAAGKRTASIFTTSYIRSDVPKGAQRPVFSTAARARPRSGCTWATSARAVSTSRMW